MKELHQIDFISRFYSGYLSITIIDKVVIPRLFVNYSYASQVLTFEHKKAGSQSGPSMLYALRFMPSA
jgi:hypothetical protein